MSAFPERLWQPTEKDLRGSFAPRSFIRRNRSTNAGIAVVVSWNARDVAAVDDVVLVRHICGVGDAGAAQNCVQLIARFTDNSTLPTYSDVFLENKTFNAWGVTWTGELALLPVADDSISLTAIFDVGAAVNAAVIGVAGIIIPRGNWQIGPRVGS